MPNKDELVADAASMGVQGAEDMTKVELEDAIASKAPTELGPVIPEGSAPEPPKPGGRRITGVQPVKPEDIPEAGR